MFYLIESCSKILNMKQVLICQSAEIFTENSESDLYFRFSKKI